MMILKKGDLVRLNGRRGEVILASENGRSVAIELEEGLPTDDGGFLLNYAMLDIDYEHGAVTEILTKTDVNVEVYDGITLRGSL